MCAVTHGTLVERSDLFKSAGFWLNVYIVKNLHLVRLVHLRREIKRRQCHKVTRRIKPTERVSILHGATLCGVKGQNE